MASEAEFLQARVSVICCLIAVFQIKFVSSLWHTAHTKNQSYNPLPAVCRIIAFSCNLYHPYNSLLRWRVAFFERKNTHLWDSK